MKFYLESHYVFINGNLWSGRHLHSFANNFIVDEFWMYAELGCADDETATQLMYKWGGKVSP